MSEKLEDIELRSEEVQEILTKVPHWMIRWGSIVFSSLILLLFLISWFVKYPDIILSKAIVTTKIPPEKLFAKTTGKIQAILVEENQKVTINQPLAILENTANYEDVFKLKSIIDTITFDKKTFEFPIDSLPLLFLGEIESQYALFENSYIKYKLNKKLQPFSNEIEANTYALSELNKQLKSLKSQKKINNAELAFKAKELERSKNLFRKGVIAKQLLETKELEYAKAARNFQNFEISLSQIREALNKAKKTSKGTKINRITDEMLLLKNTIHSFNQLKKAIKNWELRYVLRSSILGKVCFLNVWSINQTVQEGRLVFSIIPDKNSSFIAQLKAPVQNSGKIKIGQTVNIKLENYPDVEFGILKGKVNRIAVIPDKEGNYFINVSLPKKLITSYNKEIAFKQEMLGSAEIITEDLRLIERFLISLKRH